MGVRNPRLSDGLGDIQYQKADIRRTFVTSSPSVAEIGDAPRPMLGQDGGPRNVKRVLKALRRQAWLAGAGLVIGLGLGLAYLMLAPYRFTAVAALLLDSQAQVGVETEGGRASLIDAARVESQMEVMRSDQIIRDVIVSLSQAERDSLAADLPSTGRTAEEQAFPSMFAGQPTLAETETLRRNLRVNRIERTYVLNVNYTSKDPALAATIANGFVREYIENQSKLRIASQEKSARELAQKANALNQQIARLETDSPKIGRSSTSVDDSIFKKRELDLRIELARKELEGTARQQQELARESRVSFLGARSIKDASRPFVVSEPKVPIVLALSLLLGTALGGAMSAVRELSDRAFRTGSAVVDELQVPFLGMLPLFPRLKQGKGGSAARTLQGPGGAKPVPASYTLYLDAPLSRYAEVLRGIRVAVDARATSAHGQSIGITSVFPGEGKTTLSANLAFSLAAEGSSVLLVDGDIRRARLSATMADPQSGGMVDLVSAGSHLALADLVYTDPARKLAFLPAGGRVVGRSSSLAVADVRNFVEEARESFDYIVFDLPPVGPVAASKSLHLAIDHFVVVASWGRTPVAAVRRLLANDARLSSRLLGVALNQVKMSSLSSYETNEDGQTSSYDAYFVEPGASQGWSIKRAVKGLLKRA